MICIDTPFGIRTFTILCYGLFLYNQNTTGDPLHSRALAHSRAPLFTQPCPHCSHSRAPGEQWARLCVFTLQGCVQAARLCRGSPVNIFREGITYVFHPSSSMLLINENDPRPNDPRLHRPDTTIILLCRDKLLFKAIFWQTSKYPDIVFIHFLHIITIPILFSPTN